MAKYTIKKGDTYWGITKALTGRGGQYNKLVELNHTPSIKLKIGQVIEVPDEWVTPKSTKLFKGTPKAGDIIKGDELFDDYTYTAADEELDNKIANDTYLKTNNITANTRLRTSTSKSRHVSLPGFASKAMANTGTTDAPSIEYTPIKEDDVYPDNWKPDYYSYLPGKMYKTNYPNSPTPALNWSFDLDQSLKSDFLTFTHYSKN